MLSWSRFARSKATGAIASQTARAVVSTVNSANGIVMKVHTRSQSTTIGRQAPAPPEKRKVEPMPNGATEAAVTAMKKQLSDGASTKDLLDSFVEHLESLHSHISRNRLAKEVVIPMMKHASAEINKPGQTELIPTPHDILNKAIIFQAAPPSGFVFVARALLADDAVGKILPFWVSFLEFKSEMNIKAPGFEDAFKKVTALAFIRSMAMSNSEADPKVLKDFLQSEIPSQNDLLRELRFSFGRNPRLLATYRADVEKFFLQTRDPNSLGHFSEAYDAAQIGRAQPVRYALTQARKIAEASGTPLAEETYVFFMKMFTQLNMAQEALKLWNEIIASGYPPSISAWNALLVTVSKTGPKANRLGQVESVLQKMPERNAETDAALILIYTRGDRLDLVEEIVSTKLDTSPLVAQAYVQSLSILNDYTKARDVLAQLQEKNIPLNTETYNNVLALLVRRKKFEEVRPLLDEMIAAGFSPDVATYSILIDFTLKSLRSRGEIPTDQTFKLFFDELESQGLKPNEYTYTAIMDGLSRSGAISTAQGLFQYLQSTGRASAVTYTSIFTNEFNNRRPREAEAHFQDFLNEGYQIRPQHWAALFEGFMRNGLPQKSLEHLIELDAAGNSTRLLNIFSLYFLLRTADNQQNKELADKVLDVVVQNNLEKRLTSRSLQCVKSLLDQGVVVPESILALL